MMMNDLAKYEKLTEVAYKHLEEWRIEKDKLDGNERIALKRKVIFAIKNVIYEADNICRIFSDRQRYWTNDLIDIGLENSETRFQI